jgi:hypothetical protein
MEESKQGDAGVVSKQSDPEIESKIRAITEGVGTQTRSNQLP